MALSIGSLLAGRYEITAPIATGGMGEVWKAHDRVLGRIVAAKVLKTEYTNDPSFLARFRNEARHTAALSHPNIASVYDYGETTDDTGVQTLAFLVMEFVEGQPLVTILHEQGRLPVDWTLHVLGQSADGLSAAHRAGVVHRDIKPGNLIVRPDGVVKLTDFGIAQARDAAPLTRTGMVVGTAQYLSPEQAQGMEVDSASDVYSLGVVGYECLAGGRPFDGASQVAIALAHINRPPPPLPGDIPPAVRLLIDRALAKNPSDRFADGGAFAEAVRRVAGGGSVAPAAVTAATALVAPATAPTQVVGTGAATDRTQVVGTGPAADRTQVFATPAAGMPTVSPGTGGRPMPPLHAPPDDEGQWPPEKDEPSGTRQRSAWIAAAVGLLLLVAGVAYLLLAGDGGDGATRPGTTSTAPSSSAGPTGLFLDPALFVGRPADEVAAELVAAGLEPVQEPADQDVLESAGQALDAGDIAGIDPSGRAALPGTTVTLHVAGEAWDPDVEDEEEPADTEAPPTRTSTPPTTAEPTPTTTAPTTTAVPTTSAPATSSTAPGSTAAGSSATAPVPPEPEVTEPEASGGNSSAPVTGEGQ